MRLQALINRGTPSQHLPEHFWPLPALVIQLPRTPDAAIYVSVRASCAPCASRLQTLIDSAFTARHFDSLTG